MYKKGHGVPNDYVKAYSHWSVAAALNNNAARKNISYIETKMTPEQIAEGQKQAEVIWNKIQK
jgi:TPR repeat protein